MHAKINARVRRRVLQAKSVANAENVRYPRPHCAYVVSIGNTDLPAFISDGILYVAAPLPLVFEAFAESFPEFVSDLEIGVSAEGGSTFSLDRDGRPVPSPQLALESLVSDSEVGR